MILKPGRFYETQQNYNLMASDRAAPASRDARSGHGGKVVGIVSMGDMVMFTKQGRYRYVQVMYKDMTGWIWLPTNVATHLALLPVDSETEPEVEYQKRGPFVKPTSPRR